MTEAFASLLFTGGFNEAEPLMRRTECSFKVTSEELTVTPVGEFMLWLSAGLTAEPEAPMLVHTIGISHQLSA